MKILTASLTAGLFLLGTAQATAITAGTATVPKRPGTCGQLFTVAMGKRAARAVYAGARRVTLHGLRVLGYIERCQIYPANQGTVRLFDRHMGRIHKLRVFAASVPALAYGQWAIPAPIVNCESTYQNLPPNSAGASGWYQIIPSTWKSYGGTGPAAYLAPKSEQDAVASRIWDGGKGSGQWVCAGRVAWRP